MKKQPAFIDSPVPVTNTHKISISIGKPQSVLNVFRGFVYIKLLLALVMLPVLTISAQVTNQFKKAKPTRWVFGIKGDEGSVVIHTKAIEAMRGARPIGTGLEMSRQANDSISYNHTSSYTRVGVQLQYVHYGTPILGNSYMASYFIQPVYRINKRFHFFFRSSLGLSYSDNPFNPHSPIDTLNQSFSLHWNPYLQVTAGVGVRINKQVSVEMSSGFNHISNANINRPNRGLNWLTSSIHLLYTPAGNELTPFHYTNKSFWKHRPFQYRLGVLYVTPQDYAGSTMDYQRTYAAGVFAEASKQIGRIHGLVGGIQVYYNHFNLDNPNPDAPYNPTKHSSTLAGIYLGHEFLLGRVIISQVIGRYITPHPNFYNPFFHQHSFKYLVSKHWQPGFSFRAHEDEADFVSLNMAFTL